MNHLRVNQILRDEPGVPKVMSLSDGRRYRIRGLETWLAGPLGFILLTPKGEYVHVGYRNIASITKTTGNGRGGK